MKRKLLVLLCVVSVLLCGCANDNMMNGYSNANASTKNRNGTFEWISPDGVHYWVYNDVYKYGIAPRYDANGKLVIDGR